MTLNWRKSSHSGGGGGSGNGGDCVEVAYGPTGPLVRDSKTGDTGRMLHAAPTAFDALLHTIKRG
ncbi:uncharacterized protein DUF397 [Herbihabitans rhizosphaerae]|uniref:Uncharacterized protein DUF397 n=1 Tax=Herbihabitans rhizosphaerae TaxID=1872711 RepID=A0A4Q7KNZ9_9PSEU|nr:uncharacterized protein DUF397 [Herbihabitans rhizosphaerae]